MKLIGIRAIYINERVSFILSNVYLDKFCG